MCDAGAAANNCRTDGIDPKAVEQLQRIVDETRCSLVLSSTWRLIHSLPLMRAKLAAKGMRAPVPLYDKTPDLDPEDGALSRRCRGHEIDAWIDRVGYSGWYVCLDDDSDFLPGQPLVKTRSEQGLTAADAEACIAILSGARRSRPE